MKLVKAIQFRAPVVQNFTGEIHVRTSSSLYVQFFEQLEKDSLRSFDWDPAT